MAGSFRKSGGAVLLIAGAVALGACARHEHAAHHRGSIKDSPVERPSHAKRIVRRAEPAHRHVEARAPDPYAASVPPPRVLPPVREARTPRPARVVPAPEAPVPPAAPPLAAARPEAAPAPAPAAPSATVAPPGSTAPPAGAPPIAAPADTVVPPLAPTEDPQAVNRLLAEGRALFEAGKVREARRRFVAAMNGPVPEVLLALARSYDTYYLSRLPASDAAPDMQRALVLYERAVERVAVEANADLARTREILKVPPR